MSVATGGKLLALAMIAILGLAYWYQVRHPRQIVATGSVRVESRSHPGPPVTLKTRTVAINGLRFEEVEMPGGTWIGCAGDCRKAALEAGPEFWDALRAKSGGR